MSSPPVLACADLGDHVVDLMIGTDGRWHVANDDRSVCAAGADPDAALDHYLLAIEAARSDAA